MVQFSLTVAHFIFIVFQDETSSFFSLQCDFAFHRHWNKQFTEDEARKAFEQTLKLEQEFGEHFTGQLVRLKCYC